MLMAVVGTFHQLMGETVSLFPPLYTICTPQRATLPLLFAVVVAYQLIGGGIEALLTGNLAAPLQDWQLGWPGLLLQVVAGWWIINRMHE